MDDTENLWPQLIRGDEGGPLSRRLINIKLARLADFASRAAALSLPRVSGLSDFEWRVLARVCETPPLSINEISGLLHRGVAQVSRTVKRLVAMGLLKSERRGGGPGVAVSPTPLGATVYEPLVARAVQNNAALISGLEPEDLERLENYIEILTRNALKLLASEQRLQAKAAQKAAGV